MSDGEFSVWEFAADGTHWPMQLAVDAKRAVGMARVLVDCADLDMDRPAPVARIIITDGGDHTVFEWRRGEGVTWPRWQQNGVADADRPRKV